MYPPLIKPRPMEPDYTKSVSHIEKWTYTQGRCTPLIEPRATEPKHTK